MRKSTSVLAFLFLTFVFISCQATSADLPQTSNKSNLTNCEKRQHKTSSGSSAVGFVGAGVAIVMFGSNFVPVKKIVTGDGMFFQWIVCLGIWLVGLVVHLYNGAQRKFFPLAMAGGAIWCTGNICVVPIIKTVGLALGLLIWCLVNLLSGWATGRFGTFGLICKQPVRKSALNYAGVVCAMISLGIFIFVKNEGPSNESRQRIEVGNERERVENSLHDDEDFNNREDTYLINTLSQRHDDASWLDRLSLNQKRLVGIVLSVLSGILYGVNFIPMYVIQKNDKHAPDSGLEYVFSQFCGVFMTSTIYFLIYCLYKRNKPDIFPSAIVPGVLSGILWAIGDVGWFIANTSLSETVSFPIVMTGPGIIASIWGILVFKEITGIRNYIILGAAFCFSITGAVLTGLSK